ncbi:MAG: hypothetical protein BRD24_00480, partial [Halobacteriales archaeon SW_9_67_24]
YGVRYAQPDVESAEADDTGRAPHDRLRGRHRRPRMVTHDPPGIGFPGRDGTLPAMTPAVSVPGDSFIPTNSVPSLEWIAAGS